MNSKKFFDYFIIFVIYCVIGWIYEVVLALIYGWGFTNRGFIFGPYLPVYGFGALVLTLTLGKVMKKRISLGKVNLMPFIVFILIMLITSAIELATGYALEMIFQKRWWDYSNDWMNFNGFICPRTSFRFGLGGMLFLYVLNPVFFKLCNKLTYKVKRNISIVLGIILTIDFVWTLAF